jgi:hypothetical protein
MLVELVKSILLLSLSLAGMHNSVRLYADLFLDFVATVLKLLSVFNLSFKILLQIKFVFRKDLYCGVYFIETLLLSVNFLVVESQLLQPFIVEVYNFIQALFSLTMVKFRLFQLIFCFPRLLLFRLSF